MAGGQALTDGARGAVAEPGWLQSLSVELHDHDRTKMIERMKPPRMGHCWPAAMGLVLGLALTALPAMASMNLALDKGCLSCHGTPPRGKAPTFAQLAQTYAKYRGQEDQMLRLAERLREHHLFGGVPAHERLSTEEAGCFVRWLVDGGR